MLTARQFQEIVLTDGNDHSPGYRVHTACDVKQYSSRDHDTQLFVQSQLKELQARAARHAHVALDKATVQNHGDGNLIRWPATTSAVDILSKYIPALYNELFALNRRLADGSGIQMRFAVAAGTSEMSPTGGLVGMAVVVVSRLVDSKEIRDELTTAGHTPLIVFVDDAVYQDIIGPKLGHLNPALYRRVDIHDRDKGFERTAWMTMPGHQPDPDWFGRDISPRPGLERSPEADEPKEPKSGFRGWHHWTVAVKVAAIGATATVTAAAITAAVTLATAASNPPPVPGSNTSTIPSTTTTTTVSSTPTSSPHGTVHKETTANRRGVPTFRDTSGSASSAGSIPYGTEVDVSCVAPNNSGMSSINAFYRIETGRWRRTYAPANTFANGDPLGTVGTHDIDPAVPPC
jgi:hypothetical protein